MKLVEALRKRIERKKKNQSQIADRQRVSNWINGKAVPSLEHGIRILRLIEGKGEMKERNLETLQLPENAFIWTKEDREKIIGSNQAGVEYLRIAIANTPKDCQVVILPDWTTENLAYAFPYKEEAKIVVPFPNDWRKLMTYLHECGHVTRLRNLKQSPPEWIGEVNAEFFGVLTIALSKLPTTIKKQCAECSRGYIIARITEAFESTDCPDQYIANRILWFLQGESVETIASNRIKRSNLSLIKVSEKQFTIY
jgi:transcriptional regulator with XRE-family HTH domain